MSQQPISAPFSRLASATESGLMTPADFIKLSTYPSAPVITSVTVANGLSLAAGVLSLGLAGVGASGAVSAAAQTFAGAKIFNDPMVAGGTAVGTTYAAPALRLPLLGFNQVHMLQFGGPASGSIGANDWEFALGFYTGAGAPIISSRAGPLLISLGSGIAMCPLSPAINDMGSLGNYWRDMYLGRDLYFKGGGEGRVVWDGGGGNSWQIAATPGSGVMRFGNNSSTYMGLRFSDGFTESLFGFEAPVYRSPVAGTTSLNFESWMGAGASDTVARIGTRIADASVGANVKLLVLGTAMSSGSIVERAVFKKSGADGFSLGASSGLLSISSAGTSVGWNLSTTSYDSNNIVSAANASVWGRSNGADGAGAVAAYTHSASSWANAGARLHAFRNASVDVSAIMANGEFEHTVAGAGIVLKSPDGTRHRITVSNAHAVVVTTL